MSLQQHQDVQIQGTALGIEPCSQQHTAKSSTKVAPAPSKDQHVSISHGQALLGHTDEDQEISPVSSLISPELRAALKCLGITDGALVSWHTFHVSSVRAMLHFFISALVTAASFAYLQYGTRLNYLYITVPNFGALIFLIGYIGAIWRYGPAAAKSRVFIMTLPVSWTCMSMVPMVR
jgi:hypothetical protein